MRNSPETWNRNSLWWGWFGAKPFHTLTKAGKGIHRRQIPPQSHRQEINSVYPQYQPFIYI